MTRAKCGMTQESRGNDHEMKVYMNKNISKNLIFSLSLALVVTASVIAFSQFNKASAASCERTYGGGLNCDRMVRLRKEVRLNDGDSFKETITNVQKGQIFTFRISVVNNGDVDLKDLDLTDELPKELELVSNGGSLSNHIDVLDNSSDVSINGCSTNSNAAKVYCLRARIKDTSFAQGVQKCVVNLARLKGSLDNDSSNRQTLATDTAVVCFGQGLTQLPKTGGEGTIAYTVLGLGMFLVGLVIKRVV